MPVRTAAIRNQLGLHARAAAAFVRLSTTFDCGIFVSAQGIEVDGKSIMGVMMLAARKGTELQIRAEGPGAEAALEKLCELVANRFGEEA
ncbi:MAG: HPr family phosphocarrier protein [Nitrospinota bacterium]